MSCIYPDYTYLYFIGSNEACAQQQDEIDGSDEEPSESAKRPRKVSCNSKGMEWLV